jgi:hypothetical protein
MELLSKGVDEVAVQAAYPFLSRANYHKKGYADASTAYRR